MTQNQQQSVPLVEAPVAQDCSEDKCKDSSSGDNLQDDGVIPQLDQIRCRAQTRR